jgi:spermidine/putrescine transport system substrate-binding protein
MAKKILFLSLLFFTACTRPSVKELRLYTWSEYFDPAVIAQFEKESGAKVKLDYFASNEEMLAKLKLLGNERSYDLILPSDYMVRTMIELKLLQPIKKDLLPFLADFEAEGLNPPYDPNLQFSVPLSVGFTGLAWNSKLILKLPEPFSWKDFFENPSYKGKVTLLDDTKEVMHAALMAQGKDALKADQVMDAFAYLKKHKGQIKGFTSETRPTIEAGECALCMAYSGDVRSVAAEKPEIKFVIPKEGATIWTDNFAIPASSPEAELAHKFIAMMLSAEGAKAFTERTGYRTYNRKARSLLSKEVVNDEIVFPKSGKFHFLMDHKEKSKEIESEWAQLKSE